MNIKNVTILFIISVLAFLTVGSQPLQATEVEFPLTQAFCYFPYWQHHTLAKKELKLSLAMNYSSVYSFDNRRLHLNDMETLCNTLSMRYGLAKNLTIEAYYRMGIGYGGVMDKFIMDFHKTFDMPMGGRDQYPRNIVQYYYKDKFSYTDNLSWQSPLVLGVVGKIWQKNKLSLNARLALGIPLSSKPGFTSKKGFITPGLALVYQNTQKKLTISWANHIAYFASPDWLAGDDLKNHIYHTELRIDYHGVFAGALYRSTPFKIRDEQDISELANPAYIVYLGVRLFKYFQFSIVEEFPPLDTVPDVSFNLRINLLGK